MILPSSGPSDGSTIVALTGEHMLGAHEPLCKFGGDPPTEANFVSSSLVKCEASSHDEGAAVVEVSVNDHGQSFTSSGVVFEYEAEPRIYALSQIEGVHTGGTPVLLTVDSVEYARAVSCRFGTIGPIFAKALSPSKIECMTPSHVPAPVQVGISTNSQSFAGDGVSFVYRQTVDAHAVYP